MPYSDTMGLKGMLSLWIFGKPQNLLGMLLSPGESQFISEVFLGFLGLSFFCDDVISPTSPRKSGKPYKTLKYDSCMVLTPEKWVAIVILDKDMCIERCMALLNDHKVYQKYKDQTKSIHAKLLRQLHELKISIRPKFKDQYI